MEHPLGNQTAICCYDVRAILKEGRRADEESPARSGIHSRSDSSGAIKRPLHVIWQARQNIQAFYEATQIHSEEQQEDQVDSVTE